MPDEIAPTTVARLVCADKDAARRIADFLDDSLDADDAVCAAFEADDGSWQVALHFRDAAGRARRCAIWSSSAAGDEAAQAVTFEQVEPKDWVAESLSGLDAGARRPLHRAWRA